MPDEVENLFKLPEVWLFRCDPWLEGQKKGFASLDYDVSRDKWQNVSAWDVFESQGYYEVGGQFWYRVNFKAPKFPAGKKVYLRIGSIDDGGEVFLNGVKAGESGPSGNWDKSFELDVTSLIKPEADNLIVIRGYDAFGGGGLWRPAALYTK